MGDDARSPLPVHDAQFQLGRIVPLPCGQVSAQMLLPQRAVGRMNDLVDQAWILCKIGHPIAGDPLGCRRHIVESAIG